MPGPFAARSRTSRAGRPRRPHAAYGDFSGTRDAANGCFSGENPYICLKPPDYETSCLLPGRPAGAPVPAVLLRGGMYAARRAARTYASLRARRRRIEILPHSGFGYGGRRLARGGHRQAYRDDGRPPEQDRHRRTPQRGRRSHLVGARHRCRALRRLRLRRSGTGRRPHERRHALHLRFGRGAVGVDPRDPGRDRGVPQFRSRPHVVRSGLRHLPDLRLRVRRHAQLPLARRAPPCSCATERWRSSSPYGRASRAGSPTTCVSPRTVAAPGVRCPRWRT